MASERATERVGQIRASASLSGLAAAAVWLALPRPVHLTDLLLGVAISSGITWLGLAAARPFGMGAPLLAGRGETKTSKHDMALRPVMAMLGGVLLGALVLAVLLFLLVPIETGLAARLRSRAAAPLWTRLAIAVEASILEELSFRLFLMSGLLWIVGRGWRRPPLRHATTAVWACISVSALAFAAAHLPSWLAATTPTATLVGSVVALNGLAGVVFGLIYWRWGIEAAILSHFSADLATQVVGPRLVLLVGGG